VTRRRERRRRKLLYELKVRRRYSHLKEEDLDRTMWRARFGKGLGPVVRKTDTVKNEQWRIMMTATNVQKCTRRCCGSDPGADGKTVRYDRQCTYDVTLRCDRAIHCCREKRTSIT